jgi:hypothetical protein
MKSRLVFKVEKKIGTIPDISYKSVFEREVSIGDDSSAWFITPSVEEIIKALSFLFPDHRVLVICE